MHSLKQLSRIKGPPTHLSLSTHSCRLEGSFYVTEPQNMTALTQLLIDLSNLQNRNSHCTNWTKAQFCRTVHLLFQQEMQHLTLIKASQYFFLFYCQPLIITCFNIYIFTQTIPDLTDYNTKAATSGGERFSWEIKANGSKYWNWP